MAGFCRRGESAFAHALLGLENEVRGFVAVDEIGRGGAIGGDAGDRAVEDEEVFLSIGRGGVRAGNAKKVAEFGKEHLVVCPLGSAGCSPAGNEGINRSHNLQDTGNLKRGDAKTKTFGMNECREALRGYSVTSCGIELLRRRKPNQFF